MPRFLKVVLCLLIAGLFVGAVSWLIRGVEPPRTVGTNYVGFSNDGSGVVTFDWRERGTTDWLPVSHYVVSPVGVPPPSGVAFSTGERSSVLLSNGRGERYECRVRFTATPKEIIVPLPSEACRVVVGPGSEVRITGR